MFEIVLLDKEKKTGKLPCLFDLLYENMCEIAPTGDSRESDYEIWKSYMASALDDPAREILLIKHGNDVIGYFQYSLRDACLVMEEMQIRRDYWASGAFRSLYRVLAKYVPESTTSVKAYANKNNLKSQAILEHLGLSAAGENKSGTSFLYTGDCQKMLSRYRA